MRINPYKVFALAFIGLMLNGCSYVEPCKEQSKEREQYWQQQLTHDLPILTPKEDVLKWATAHSLHFTQYRKGNVGGTLEIVRCTFGYPCTHWNIEVTFEFNPKNQLMRIETNRLGICL